MKWYHYIAYFFGGAFLVNSVPHFTNGVSGRPFPSPFATPPGQGLSPAWVNVLWGLFNLLIGYLLVCRVGDFSLRKTRDVAVAGIGALAMALMLAQAFARVYTGR
ncbi:MAG: hypothetical protein LAO08_05355 [Acidobacteriia bacterium]|nr:hypothetical protein [Terriglobia bacterium]